MREKLSPAQVIRWYISVKKVKTNVSQFDRW